MTTVVITEKPDAMNKIASSLGKPKKIQGNNFYWYEIDRNRQKIIVTCAVGHLFVLDAKGKWVYPIFDAQWVPVYSRKGSEFVKKYFDTLSEAVKKGDEFVVATDFDTEGEVIGYNILKFLAHYENARRMKFSSMTKEELTESFENASPTIYFNQVESGLTRHYLDFFWGINLTRALTLAIKNSGEKAFAILSTGRVQGPTLAMLYEREHKIKQFKPTPFWQLILRIKLDDKEFIAHHEEEKIWEKDKADKILEGSKGKDAIVKLVKKKEYKQLPPPAFNTTDLQAEAYTQFRYTPTQTLAIAETLYQSGYISYPRSSSQKLPPNINYAKIIKALAALNPYGLAQRLLSTKLLPVQGKRDDPAHPAIHPTFEVPDLKKLNSQQRKLYDLIMRRFLSAFADAAVRESNTVTLDVGGNNFILVGKRTISPGWLEFYSPYVSVDELVLPELKVGDEVKVLGIDELAKETQPPSRYTPASILKEMEKRNLGTRATRADILKTLYDRKYITGQSITVTRLGEVVVNALKEYSPKILSEELTRKFEEEMDKILKGEAKREKVIDEAKVTLTEILSDFKKNETGIGKILLEGLIETRRQENKLGKCPNCGSDLRIIVSKKTGKRFCGCSNYPTCKTAFPLPLRGQITALNKSCEKCGTPMIQVRRYRKPFNMCLNPNCETKASWKVRKA
jgi:DNA topoisomerase-1